MKNIKPTLVCLVMFCTCMQVGYTQRSAGNTQVVQALFNAINRHDSVAVANYFADSATLESPNWEGVQTGKAAVITIYSRYFTGTPDISYKISNIISGGNAIVVEYTFGGKFSNPEAGTPEYMRNKTYYLKGSTRYNFNRGKIVHAVSYFDQVAFLRQVGFFDAH